MNTREIKCPQCKQWTLWAGNHYDRCLYCNAFLEPKIFTAQVEKKALNQVRIESDPLFINPNDSKLTREWKTLLHYIRMGMAYLQVGFFAFITVLLFILGLCAV